MTAPAAAGGYAIVTEWLRVFWRGMDLETATRWARALEPYPSAWMVVPDAGVAHGEKVRLSPVVA